MKPAKSRRCERPGCNRKQGWQEINGIRVYSLYCGDHTCRVRRSDDPRLQLHFCLQPCKKNLRFCEKRQSSSFKPSLLPYGTNFCEDMTCGKKDCHRKNYDKSNEMLATIPWFCHEHAAATSLKTSDPSCNEPTGENRYCGKHACRLAGCPAAAMLPDSRYCFVNKHACFRKRCPEPAITPGGPCKGHGCKKSGCTATSKLSYGGYCMTNGHACVKPNCGKSKVGVIDGIDVELCADHFYDDSLKIAIEVSKLEAERRKEQRHELLCREEKWHQQQKREQQKREQENRKQKQHVDRKREQHTREQEQLEQQRRKQAVPRGETLGAEQPRRSCPEMAELPSYESLFPFRR
ncbi:hypothetical protein GQ53DRAFT_885947 [Thozetella sp. PMI_491]|nr:hypothetical protein GQ53DRAFT_885947 [Thozetella sp. PMI_491]